MGHVASSQGNFILVHPHTIDEYGITVHWQYRADRQRNDHDTIITDEDFGTLHVFHWRDDTCSFYLNSATPLYDFFDHPSGVFDPNPILWDIVSGTWSISGVVPFQSEVLYAYSPGTIQFHNTYPSLVPWGFSGDYAVMEGKIFLGLSGVVVLNDEITLTTIQDFMHVQVDDFEDTWNTPGDDKAAHFIIETTPDGSRLVLDQGNASTINSLFYDRSSNYGNNLKFQIETMPTDGSLPYILWTQYVKPGNTLQATTVPCYEHINPFNCRYIPRMMQIEVDTVESGILLCNEQCFDLNGTFLLPRISHQVIGLSRSARYQSDLDVDLDECVGDNLFALRSDIDNFDDTLSNDIGIKNTVDLVSRDTEEDAWVDSSIQAHWGSSRGIGEDYDPPLTGDGCGDTGIDYVAFLDDTPLSYDPSTFTVTIADTTYYKNGIELNLTTDTVVVTIPGFPLVANVQVFIDNIQIATLHTIVGSPERYSLEDKRVFWHPDVQGVVCNDESSIDYSDEDFIVGGFAFACSSQTTIISQITYSFPGDADEIGFVYYYKMNCAGSITINNVPPTSSEFLISKVALSGSYSSLTLTDGIHPDDGVHPDEWDYCPTDPEFPSTNTYPSGAFFDLDFEMKIVHSPNMMEDLLGGHKFLATPGPGNGTFDYYVSPVSSELAQKERVVVGDLYLDLQDTPPNIGGDAGASGYIYLDVEDFDVGEDHFGGLGSWPLSIPEEWQHYRLEIAYLANINGEWQITDTRDPGWLKGRRGFENKDQIDISINIFNQTVTVKPQAKRFSYYHNNIRYTKTGSESVNFTFAGHVFADSAVSDSYYSSDSITWEIYYDGASLQVAPSLACEDLGSYPWLGRFITQRLIKINPFLLSDWSLVEDCQLDSHDLNNVSTVRNEICDANSSTCQITPIF